MNTNIFKNNTTILSSIEIGTRIIFSYSLRYKCKIKLLLLIGKEVIKQYEKEYFSELLSLLLLKSDSICLK